jgi:acetoin utilization deacetylase AcuC-like enzyme
MARCHPVEMPHRADTILERVRHSGLGEIARAAHYDSARYARVHSERYVRFLEQAWQEWSALGHQHDALPLVWPVRDLRSDIEPEHIDGKLGFYAMDAGVAITSGTWQAVRGSADTALSAMDHLLQGHDSAFALCRPPGHHAAAEYMGGYCYLNNAAIAAQSCWIRVASGLWCWMWTFTTATARKHFLPAPGCAVCLAAWRPAPLLSLLFRPSRRNRQWSRRRLQPQLPVAHGTDWAAYAIALQDACQRIRAFQPDAVVISLGVDTFEHDPISHFKLASPDYLRMGAAIAAIGAPTLFVMEGGYMVEEIGINAVNVLQGFADAR